MTITMHHLERILAGTIEKKLVEKAHELNVKVTVGYKSSTDTAILVITGEYDNNQTFAHWASKLIIDQELARNVKLQYV